MLVSDVNHCLPTIVSYNVAKVSCVPLCVCGAAMLLLGRVEMAACTDAPCAREYTYSDMVQD